MPFDLPGKILPARPSTGPGMARARSRPPLAAALVAALAPVTRASGTVQLTFDGELSPPGGARVVVAIAAGIGAAAREVRLDLHLAAGTSGADLAALLADRCAAAKLEVLAPAARGPRAHVFVEDARSVTLELDAGLGGAVTVCDGAPELLRVETPGGPETGPVRLVVAASAVHGHTARRTRSSIELGLEPGLGPAQISERLLARAVEAGWVCERPGVEGWRLSHLEDGSRITGFGVELRAERPWRLELRVPEAP